MFFDGKILFPMLYVVIHENKNRRQASEYRLNYNKLT